MEIAKFETVDMPTAAKLATVYVGSFANQPHNADVILRQVREWCLGKPVTVLGQMCNPSHGAVAKSDRPCLQALNRWYEDWTGRHAPREFKPLPDDPPISPEERARVAEGLRKLSRQLHGVVGTNCVGRPKGWKPIQQEHGLDELVKIAENRS